MLDRPWIRFDTGVEAAVAIGAVSAAVSAGVAYEGAQRQNKAAKKAIESQNRATSAQTRQVNTAAALEAEKRRSEAAKIRALLRVTAADRGGEGGSFDALINQTNQDEALNMSILETNRKNQIASVLSGAEANLIALTSKMTNPLVDGAIGGIGGFSTGLQIGGAVNQLSYDPNKGANQ